MHACWDVQSLPTATPGRPMTQDVSQGEGGEVRGRGGEAGGEKWGRGETVKRNLKNRTRVNSSLTFYFQSILLLRYRAIKIKSDQTHYQYELRALADYGSLNIGPWGS